jgi:hypothetical protein
MIKHCKLTVFALLLVISVPGVYAQEPDIYLHEEFNNLDEWKPFHFKKIKEHTIYSVEENGGIDYLKAESNSSASGMIFKKEIRILEYPIIKWRWKISNVFKKGDAKEKSGDDYPIRVYVIFKYDPENASFGQRLKYGAAKSIYGEYPPHSSLNYIWANKSHKEQILTNTYASEAKMIVLQAGELNAGKWIEQEVDIIEDYHKAFGEDPPSIASLAIMNDSDNTGESAVSYIDYIDVYRE